MKIEEIILNNFTLKYPIERLAPLTQVLFLDIETTGFSAAKSQLYLIGCAFYSEGNWHIKQWFAQSAEEEPELLKAFFTFSKNFSYLIHYNGNTFDLPYLKQKAAYTTFPTALTALKELIFISGSRPTKTF